MVTTAIYGRVFVNKAHSAPAWSGDVLTLRQQFMPSTLTEAKAVAGQFLGLMNNPDEPVIPFISGSDPDLDGFYVPVGVEIAADRTYRSSRLMEATVGLRRVANGHRNPILETYIMSRLATNSHGVISTTDHAIAAVSDTDDLLMDYSGLSGLIGSSELITTVGNDPLSVQKFANTNVSGYYSQFAYPGGHYGGSACRIEFTVDGITWYETTGRSGIPNGAGWRISNGFIRIGTAGTLPEPNVVFEVADSAQYRGSAGSIGAVRGSFDLGGYEGPFVIRNSPETCIVRVHAFSGVYITYTVWSGGTIAMMSFTSPDPTGFLLEAVTPDGTGTAVTGGVRKTTVDSNGNKMHFLSRSPVTATVTSPWSITLTTPATSGVFAIGMDLGGASASTSAFSSAGMLGQLCTPPQWRRRIVAR